jgi:hypothetical protein
MPYVPASSFPTYFHDGNGRPLANGYVEFYESGTANPATVYSDANGTPAGVRVELDARGEFENIKRVFLDTAVTYKARIFSAAGALIGTVDPLVAPYLPANDPTVIDRYARWDASGAAQYKTPPQVLADLRAARHDDLFSDWVVSGLLPATSATLTSDIAAGQAYVTGRRIDKAAASHTYTASVDTYVDLDSTGAYLFAEVANGAAAPAQPTSSVRLAKVVTDVDNITAVMDLRVTKPVSVAVTNHEQAADPHTQYAKKASEAWIAPALQNGWVNHSAEWADAGYYKDDFGLVHIKGLIKNGTTTATTLLFTLPAGYRPVEHEMFAQMSSDGTNKTATSIKVASTGEVVLDSTAGASWLTLSGITFRAA